MIFDRGNNSQGNIDMLKEDCAFDYVGGLKKNQCSSLYQAPSSAYTFAESLHMSYYRTQMEVFGDIHTVVVTDNPKLQDGQMQSIEKNRNKCLDKIKELLEKTILTDQSRRILDGLTAQNAACAAAKPAQTARSEDTGKSKNEGGDTKVTG